MRLRVALLAALAAGCSSQPYEAPGSLKVDARDIYYDVTGATAEEIRASLDRQRLESNGERWLAETQSQVRTDYRYAEAGVGECRMSHVTVTIELRTTLPRWNAPRAASAALRAQWHRFLAAARVHEKGHYDNAMAAAQEVTTALRALRTPSCGTFPHEADALLQGIFARCKARDAKYDAETRHGILQGTVWRVERSI